MAANRLRVTRCTDVACSTTSSEDATSVMSGNQTSIAATALPSGRPIFLAGRTLSSYSVVCDPSDCSGPVRAFNRASQGGAEPTNNSPRAVTVGPDGYARLVLVGVGHLQIRICPNELCWGLSRPR